MDTADSRRHIGAATTDATDVLAVTDVPDVLDAADVLAPTDVLEVLVAESGALVAGLRDVPAGRWAAPTRCRPWVLRELLAHVRVAVGRVTAMLAEPAPPVATVSAVDYYRPDARFSPATNADRVATARSAAADDEIEAFAATVSQVAKACAAQPAGRVVRTRHGDPMLLTDFLITRVVEVAVHGFDLADAAGVPSWLTPPAAGALQDLLLGPARRSPDPLHFLRAATGRASDPDLLAQLAPRLLALG
jgi:uncharacterized protein (TIGR03083 family)